MSRVFYQKWRPQRLDQVVGQEPITQTLANAVSLGRVAHAYLFCGPRGTGKTSTARILAKAVNCLDPQGGEPDNECAICQSINESRALDLIEVDAASNRGIDDVRGLRDSVRFSPNEARYKVYIVDEVHMLTPEAFNALLKTLEEPPEHVIFVLATTEVHRVPLTIVSRCQRFDFRRITVEKSVARLVELCEAEEFEADTDALSLIARASAGSLRDAENLLEQALVSYGSPLSEEQVRSLLGMDSDERALEVVGHVLARSSKDGLSTINEVAGQGADLRQFHKGVMEYLRGILLIKSRVSGELGFPVETRTRLESIAESATVEQALRALKAFVEVDLRGDSTSPLPLEMALVESTLEEDVPAAAAPVATADQSPFAGEPGPTRPAQRAPAAPSKVRETAPMATRARPRPQPTRGAPTPTPPPPDGPPGLKGQWSQILRSLSRHKGKRFNLGALLRDCSEREIEDGVLTLKFAHRSHMERMEEELEDPQSRRALQESLDQALDQTYEIRIAAADGQSTGPRQSASQRSHLVRAAQQMGARVVGEKEDQNEQEDAQAGATPPEGHDQGAGGA